MYILRIILFIKTTVSSNDCLDPGPQAIAGLRHGVPVEGPHHLLYLLDQILGFVTRLCIGPQLRFAQLKKTKISKRVGMRRAGRPDLLLLHPPKVLLEPFLHPLASVGRGAGRSNGDFQVSKCILRHYPLTFVLECSSPAPGVGGTWSETIAVITPVVRSQLRVVFVNQLTAREGSDLM